MIFHPCALIGYREGEAGREQSSGIEILNPFYTVYNSRENLRQDYHGNPRSDIMHEKVLFYTDQEFKLEIILRKTIESRVGRYHSESQIIKIRNLLFLTF